MKQIFWYFSSLSVICQVALTAPVEQISGTEQLNEILHRSARQVYGYSQPYGIQQQLPVYPQQRYQPQLPYQSQYAPVQASYLSDRIGYGAEPYLRPPTRYLSNATGFTGPQNVSLYRLNANYSGGYNSEHIYKDSVPNGYRLNSSYIGGYVPELIIEEPVPIPVPAIGYSNRSDYKIRRYNCSGDRDYLDRIHFKRRNSYNDSGRYGLYEEGYRRDDDWRYGRLNSSFDRFEDRDDAGLDLARRNIDRYDGDRRDRRRYREGNYRRRGCADEYDDDRRDEYAAFRDDRVEYGISEHYDRDEDIDRSVEELPDPCRGYFRNDTGYRRREEYEEGPRYNISLYDGDYDRDIDRIPRRYNDDDSEIERGYGPCERHRRRYGRRREEYDDRYSRDDLGY